MSDRDVRWQILSEALGCTIATPIALIVIVAIDAIVVATLR